MSDNLYIRKLKKLRNYKELAKASLWSGLLTFFLLFVWYWYVDEKVFYLYSYAVDEVLTMTLGVAALFSFLLLILAVVFFLMYRITMRNYGTDMNLWMDELGEEGMAEVFAGKGRAPIFLVLSLLLLALILGFGSVKAITTQKAQEYASEEAAMDLEEVFPGAEITAERYDDEHTVSITYSGDDYYANYDLEYLLGTDYFDPYNMNYYTSFYLRSYTAEDILADLEGHLAKVNQLYYPPGEDAGHLASIITDEFIKALHVAAADPSDENSCEFQHEYVVNNKEVDVYLNIDVHNADNPDYHNITLSFYSYCWD